MKWLDRHKEDKQTRFVELGNFVGDELNVEDFLEGSARWGRGLTCVKAL